MKPQDFKPGDPRINRDGRPPKEWTMSALYKQAGEESDETGEPRNKIVARILWKKASEGDVVAIKEINNRIDGMPKQTTDITTGGDKLTVVFHQSLKQE